MLVFKGLGSSGVNGESGCGDVKGECKEEPEQGKVEEGIDEMVKMDMSDGGVKVEQDDEQRQEQHPQQDEGPVEIGTDLQPAGRG